MAEFDVCALGELLIDFTENGISENGNPIMEANPGGAPCNVLAMLNKQGYKTAFIGKVGNDIFGRQLKAVVQEAGINTDGLVTDEQRLPLSTHCPAETASSPFTETLARI